MNMKKVYLVLTHTGTWFSKRIRKHTGDTYNHVSIALKEDLSELYSFGRRNPYVFFYGGFVVEGLNHGTFKRFSETTARVYELEVEDDAYSNLERQSAAFIAFRKKYHYNHMGILKARKNIDYQRNERCFYCSQFVYHVLVEAGILARNAFQGAVTPGKMATIPGLRLIYEGLLREYRAAAALTDI